MHAIEQLRFETDDHERVYEYVERNGAVTSEELEATLSIEPSRLEATIDDLEDDGFLEEERVIE